MPSHLGYDVMAIDPVPERRALAERRGIEVHDLTDDVVGMIHWERAPLTRKGSSVRVRYRPPHTPAVACAPASHARPHATLSGQPGNG